jgi:hypothetical protein
VESSYQPAQKWLKDRKRLKPEFDDILHYQKIIVVLTETGRTMKEIDKVGGSEVKDVPTMEISLIYT